MVGLLLFLAGSALAFNLHVASQPPERQEGATGSPSTTSGAATDATAGTWAPKSAQVLGPAVAGVSGHGVVETIVSIESPDPDFRRPILISTGGASQPATLVEAGAGWAIFALAPKKGSKSTSPTTILCQLLADGSLRVGDASGSLVFIRN